MIVQETADGRRLVRQTDHALLSGTFADTWGSEALPAPPRTDETVTAAARHDDGWAEWELAPGLDADGGPVDFLRDSIANSVARWRRGVALVAEEDAFAALVVSMHGERLFSRPFEPGLEPRLARLGGADRELAEDFVVEERRRQGRLLTDLGSGAEEDAEEAWRLLQVWDRLSLFVCMRRLVEGDAWTMPPIRGADGSDVEIHVRAEDASTVSLDPYPFAVEPLEGELAVFELAGERWESTAAFRRAFRTAPRRILRFTFLPR